MQRVGSETKIALLVAALAATIMPLAVLAQSQLRQVNIAFFEAGDYTLHDPMRETLREEIDRIFPSDTVAVYPPYGFRSVEWKRSACKAAASELAGMKGIDIIVAIGPWVARDLLEAKCAKPIIALGQLSPLADGLVDGSGRPTAPNLTVAYDPAKLDNDLRIIKRMLGVKNLGLLFFHAPGEGESFLGAVTSAAAKLDMKTVTSEGYNNAGVYAFFKAYGELDKKVDALYIGNLWGLNATAIGEFLAAAAADHFPVFAATDQHLVARGALCSTAPILLSEARFQAGKILQIIRGARPVDLPTLLPTSGAMVLGEKAAQSAKLEIPDEFLLEANLFEKRPDPTEPPLTLAEAIRLAKEQNPGYLAQLDALKAASFKAGRAASRYLPHLDLFGSAAHVDNNTVYDHDGRIQSELYTAGLSLDQTLFSLEALRAIRLAARERGRNQLTTDSGTAKLELAVSLAYLNYAKADEQVTLRLAHRSRLDQYLEITRARQALGECDSVEYRRWRSERLSASAAIAGAKNNRRVAQILLNVLLNRGGNDAITIDNRQFDADAQLEDFDRLRPFIQSDRVQVRTENFLVQQAIKLNPAVKIADSDIDLQKLRLSQNRARLFPTLDLQAKFYYRDSLRNSASFTEKGSNFSLGAKVRFPIFEGNDRSSERKSLAAQLSEFEYRRDALRIEAMGKIQSLVGTIRATGTRLLVLFGARQMSNDDLAPLEQRYDRGNASFADLSTALGSLLKTHAEALGTRFDYFESQAELLKETGWSLSDHSLTVGDELYSRLSAATGRR